MHTRATRVCYQSSLACTLVRKASEKYYITVQLLYRLLSNLTRCPQQQMLGFTVFPGTPPPPSIGHSMVSALERLFCMHLGYGLMHMQVNVPLPYLNECSLIPRPSARAQSEGRRVWWMHCTEGLGMRLILMHVLPGTNIIT